MKKGSNWSLGEAAIKVSKKAIDAAKSKSVETIQQYSENQKPLSPENWCERTAQTCEALSDSIMGNSGWTNKLVSVASSKLGAGIIGVRSRFVRVDQSPNAQNRT